MADGTTIQIEVQSNAAAAAQSLERLAASLDRVKQAVSGGLRLRGLANQLTNLSNAVNTSVSEEAISRIERLAAALQQLNSIGAIRLRIPRNVERVADTVAAVQQRRSDTTIPTTSTDTSAAVENTSRLQDTMSALQTISQAAGRGLGALGNALGYLGGVAVRAVTELRPLVSVIGQLSRSALRMTVSSVRAIASGMTRVHGAFSSLRRHLSMSNTSLGKLWSSMKRIAMYRLLRSAIKAVTDGLKTGINNLYQYSKAMGTQFAKSMDIGSGASLKFKNSIAAMLGPAITAAISLLTALASAAITAANAIQQVFAVLGGSGVWTRATDAVNDYADAAKGAGGATKNLLADWDELNVIQSKGGGGGGGGALDPASMFVEEEVPLNPWTEMAAKIRDAINRGDWYGAGKAISDRVNDIIANLNPEEWANKLNGFIKNGLSLAVGLLQETDFGALGAKLGAFLMGIFGGNNAVNWELIGTLLRARIMAVVNSLSGLFSTPGLFEGIGESFATLVNSFIQIDIVDVAQKIAEGINGAIVAARLFIKQVNFDTLATKIKDYLVTMFGGGKGGIDWATVGATLREGLTDVIGSLQHLFEPEGENAGIFTSIASQFAATVNSFFNMTADQKATITNTLNAAIKDAIGGVERFFADTDWGKIGEDIAYWIEKIDWEGIATKLWTMIGKIFESASTIGDYIIMGIVNSFAKVWNNLVSGTLLEKYIGTAPLFGQVEAFQQWLGSGSLEGLVMNEEGKYIQKLPEITKNADAFAEAAREAGMSVEDAMIGMLNDTNRYVEALDAASSSVEKTTGEASKSIQSQLDDMDVISSADAPAASIVIKIDPIADVGEDVLGDMYDAIYDEINNYDPDTTGLDADAYWISVLGPMVEQTAAAAGLVGDAAKSVSTEFYLKWQESLFSEDWEGSTSGLINILQESIESAVPGELPAVDGTPLVNSMADAANSVKASASQIIGAIHAINGATLTGGGSIGGAFTIRFAQHFASGGFPTAGSMFIAGEAGPELVGTMGGRTAVANSDQIVSGVASGVAAGQAEQNALLRQQNQLLTRMLNKEFTAKAVPGSSWGRFIQQSSDAYERQTGR